MKTLDDLIADLERIVYLTDADGEDEGYFLAMDCLHYLKEYREISKAMNPKVRWNEDAR